MLQDLSNGDERAMAKLEMLPDFFKTIQTRMGASELSAADLDSCVDRAMREVDDTVRFADQFRSDLGRGRERLATLH